MDYVNDLMKSLTSLGPEMLAALLVVGLGYALRLIPVCPNKWMPAVCILGAPIVYPFLTSPGRADPSVTHPLVREILTGFLIGIIAWVAHDKVLPLIEARVPFLKGLLVRGEGGSARYRKGADGKFEVVTDAPAPDEPAKPPEVKL